MIQLKQLVATRARPEDQKHDQLQVLADKRWHQQRRSIQAKENEAPSQNPQETSTPRAIQPKASGDMLSQLSEPIAAKVSHAFPASAPRVSLQSGFGGLGLSQGDTGDGQLLGASQGNHIALRPDLHREVTQAKPSPTAEKTLYHEIAHTTDVTPTPQGSGSPQVVYSAANEARADNMAARAYAGARVETQTQKHHKAGSGVQKKPERDLESFADGLPQEQIEMKKAAGKRIAQGNVSGIASRASVANLIWYVFDISEQEVWKGMIYKNSFTIPDRNHKIWNWISENERLIHTRTSTHVQGARVNDDKHGWNGLGIDYDWGEEEEKHLPHGFKTILLHKIKTGDQQRLYIKLETAGYGASNEDTSNTNWIYPHERTMMHIWNYKEGRGKVAHEEGPKDTKIPQGVKDAYNEWCKVVAKVYPAGKKIANSVKDDVYFSSLRGTILGIHRYSTAIITVIETLIKNIETNITTEDPLHILEPMEEHIRSYLKHIQEIEGSRLGGVSAISSRKGWIANPPTKKERISIATALANLWIEKLKLTQSRVGSEIVLNEEDFN
jgi:hypothetical protein